MGKCIAYHFHGYQPGDVIYRKNTSPKEPMHLVERYSPVSLKIGADDVTGDNWTDVMLRSYHVLNDAFEELSAEQSSTVCSVDIEPDTLHMILKKDEMHKTQHYQQIVNAFSQHYIDLVVTMPFHPIMFYLDEFEQRMIASIAFEFFKPMLFESKLEDVQKTRHPYIGIWLPEAAYSDGVAKSVIWAFERTIKNDPYITAQDIDACPFFIQDERQFVKPSRTFPQSRWSCNYLILNKCKTGVFGRDLRLSDAFAFSTGIDGILSSVITRRTDAAKDRENIPYVITLASDLEALLSNAAQLENFMTLIRHFRDANITPLALADFIGKKRNGTYKTWNGECESEEFRAQLKDYSSWSDYLETSMDGMTSDTRWTGIRRMDGKVVSQYYRGEAISQIWKQGYHCMSARLNDEIRRTVLSILKNNTGCTTDEAFDFLVAYNRIIFRDHYKMQGYDDALLSFDAIVETAFTHCISHDQVALAARAYYEMLMANKSCPLFWENMDTRVTFQNIVLYAHALIDLMNAHVMAGEREAADALFRLYYYELIEFETGIQRYELTQLSGLVGWETTNKGWKIAVQSEIPDQSQYNVVKRAALYVGVRDLPDTYLHQIVFSTTGIIASTNHISGELHGIWKNSAFCEHDGA